MTPRCLLSHLRGTASLLLLPSVPFPAVLTRGPQEALTSGPPPVCLAGCQAAPTSSAKTGIVPSPGGWRPQTQVRAGMEPPGVQTAIPPCVLTQSSPCACLLPHLSYEDTSPVGLGPIHMTSCYLIYLFKDSISKFSHIPRSWGSGLQQMNSGDIVKPITQSLAEGVSSVPQTELRGL